MPFDAPFLLGPFSVDAAGRIAPRDPDTPPIFVVRWRGRGIRARLVPADPSGRLLLRVALGRIPSSAASGGPGPRRAGFAALRHLPRTLPEGWRMGLSPDHTIMLEAEARAGLPITASGLLAEVTSFLLALAPYLDVLDELGVGAAAGASSAAGTAKTWPG